MSPALSPEQRAELLVSAMTLDQKIYKADGQRMSLIGDRGEQRKCRELPGTIVIEFLQRAAATIVGW